jgi:hypothetical protein
MYVFDCFYYNIKDAGVEVYWYLENVREGEATKPIECMYLKHTIMSSLIRGSSDV